MNGGDNSLDFGGPTDKWGPPPVVGEANGMAGRAVVVRPAHVDDGLSNTYLLGEKYVNPDHYADGLDLGDNENAYVGSDRDTLRHHLKPSRDRSMYDNSYAFGSAHPGVFQMALGDGSVQSISFTIDTEIHEALIRRNDGQVVGNL